jgi:hypothetical protein
VTSDFFFAQEIRIENSNNAKVFFLIFFSNITANVLALGEVGE